MQVIHEKMRQVENFKINQVLLQIFRQILGYVISFILQIKLGWNFKLKQYLKKFM